MTIERARPFLAIYCIIRKGNQVLMLKRQNTGYADGKWSFPAGHVDDGESITAAASRELKEETGLIVNQADWQFKTMIHRQSADRRTIDVFMQADNWQGSVINCEPDKCSALEFVDMKTQIGNTQFELVDYIEPIFNQLVQDDQQIQSYTELGWE